MISLAPNTQLPAPAFFDGDTAVLRPATPQLSARKEMRLHILALEVVRHAPELALVLHAGGIDRLRRELCEA